MQTIRIFFSKTDRAKYISHLDLTRCLSRAFARTQLPIWYTEGFNPHIYMTFSLPLPLGVEGMRESMDVKLTEDEFPLVEIARQLNPVLPVGMRVLEAAPPVDKPEAIVWADYEIRFYHLQPHCLKEELESFLNRESILVTKKSKHRTQELDLRPHIQVLHLEEKEGEVLLGLRTAAGPALNINPSLLLDAWQGEGGMTPEYTKVARMAVLKADLTPFA